MRNAYQRTIQIARDAAKWLTCEQAIKQDLSKVGSPTILYAVGESNLANPLVILTAIAYKAVAKLFFAACGDR